MNIVFVEWVDSCYDHEWKRLKDVSDVAFCKSVGLLVKENKDEIVIAQSLSENGNASETIAIPKCSIKKKKIIYKV